MRKMEFLSVAGDLIRFAESFAAFNKASGNNNVEKSLSNMNANIVSRYDILCAFHF